MEEENILRPTELKLVLGQLVSGSGVSEKNEYAGMISQVNIFSSPLPTASMVAITQAECGSPGDYVSWDTEEDWQLASEAKNVIVEDLEKPCRPDSMVTVYTAEFKDHSVATNPEELSGCMEHCQKLGGKSEMPPVHRHSRSGTGCWMRCMPSRQISLCFTESGWVLLMSRWSQIGWTPLGHTRSTLM